MLLYGLFSPTAGILAKMGVTSPFSPARSKGDLKVLRAFELVGKSSLLPPLSLILLLRSLRDCFECLRGFTFLLILAITLLATLMVGTRGPSWRFRLLCSILVAERYLVVRVGFWLLFLFFFQINLQKLTVITAVSRFVAKARGRLQATRF